MSQPVLQAPSPQAPPVKQRELTEKEKQALEEKKAEKREQKLRVQKYLEEQKVRLEVLEQTRAAVEVEQSQYFKKLVDRVGPVNMQVADRNLKALETKMADNLSTGKVRFEPLEQKSSVVEDVQLFMKVRETEKEQIALKQKLKNIDFELSSLQRQKIENPFSVYSQPALKVYVDEDEMQRKQKAANFVKAIHDKEQAVREIVKKKLIEEEKIEKVKEKELTDLEKAEKQQIYLIERLKKQREKHEKIRQHIAELKTKHENRLTEMMQMEEKYFKDLDSKLSKMKEKRQHLKGQKVDRSVIITGVKKMKLKQLDRSMTRSETRGIVSNDATRKLSTAKVETTKGTRSTKGSINKNADEIIKKLEVEKPLYRRWNEQFRKKEKAELLLMKQEKKKILAEQGRFTPAELETHLQAYKKKKRDLKDKYEKKRREKLQKLGLKDGAISTKNPNVSFDSKLWLFNEPEQAHQDTKHDELKQQRLKVVNYAQNVRENLKPEVTEENKLKVLIQKDKLLNPMKYVKLQKRKVDIRNQPDEELFRRDFIRPNEEEQRREAHATGVSYLKDLPTLIDKARKERKQKLLEEAATRKYRISTVKSAEGINRTQNLEVQDTWAETRKKLKLEEKAADLDNWQKIVEAHESTKLPKIKSHFGSQSVKGTRKTLDPDSEGLSRQERESLLAQKRKEDHKRRVQEMQEKMRQDQLPRIPSDAQRIKDVSEHLDMKAQRLEQIVKATWKNKPLKALEEEDHVSSIYIDSIKAKLKVLEMSSQPKTTVA